MKSVQSSIQVKANVIEDGRERDRDMRWESEVQCHHLYSQFPKSQLLIRTSPYWEFVRGPRPAGKYIDPVISHRPQLLNFIVRQRSSDCTGNIRVCKSKSTSSKLIFPSVNGLLILGPFLSRHPRCRLRTSRLKTINLETDFSSPLPIALRITSPIR